MRQSRWILLVAVAFTAVLSSCGDGEEKSAPARAYSLGERIGLGHISYVAYETQWLTHLGEGADARVPQNRFLLVRLQAANGGSKELIVPNFSLVDDNGNVFPEINDESRAVPQYIGFLRRVKPAESAQGHALFDAPPRHYQMKIMDEDGDRSALVDLPLSFTVESPEVPAIVDGSKKSAPNPAPRKK
jgi:hypothetical protein